MSSNVNYTKYVGTAGSSAVGASLITASAPNLYDGSIGDTSTFETVPSGQSLYVLLDVYTPNGSVTASATKLTFQTSSAAGYLFSFGSNDGTSWTSLGNQSIASGANTFTFAGTQTYRYYQADFYSSGSAYNVSDLRIYDASSVAMVGGGTVSPDFSISPTSQTVGLHNAGTAVVTNPDLTITAIGGFSSAVALAVTGQPGGLTATLGSTSVSPGSSTSLSLSATSAVTPGTYSLTVTGTSGALSHTQAVSAVVTAPPLAPPTQTDTLFAGNYSVTAVMRVGSNTLAAVAVYDRLFADTGTTGIRSGLLIAVGDTLFADTYSPQGAMLAGVSVTDYLFSDTGGRKPISFSPQTFLDSLFGSDTGVRTGKPSGSGGHTPPFPFADTVFSDALAQGVRNGTLRAYKDSLFASDTGQRGAISFVAYLYTDTLFGDFASSSGVRPAVSPNSPVNGDPFVDIVRFLAHLLLEGKTMIAPAKLLLILDKIAASYRTLEAQAQANTLVAVDPLIIGGDGLSNLTYGTGDESFILKTIAAADAMVTNAQPDTRNAAIYSPFMSTIATYLASLQNTNFSTLDTFATYENSLTPRSFLVHPNAAYIQFLYNNKQGNLLMSPGNVFAPLTTFATCTVGAGAGVVTFAHQSAIPTANDPIGKAQGYTPAPGASAIVTAAVNGTLTLTITASGQNAAGAPVTGRTWTATLTSAAAGSTIALVPNVAGDRISDITAVAGSGTATAGAFGLQSSIERAVS